MKKMKWNLKNKLIQKMAGREGNNKQRTDGTSR